MEKRIRTHEDLLVYNMAFSAAMAIFEITKTFPKEERYSLTDQIRRSSRSVCANTAEGFRKRRYPKSFVAKLSDAETEASETKVWLDFALNCNYIDQQTWKHLKEKYDNIIGKLVRMIKSPENWTF